jgi:hypothetical protein
LRKDILAIAPGELGPEFDKRQTFRKWFTTASAFETPTRQIHIDLATEAGQVSNLNALPAVSTRRTRPAFRTNRRLATQLCADCHAVRLLLIPAQMKLGDVKEVFQFS